MSVQVFYAEEDSRGVNAKVSSANSSFWRFQVTTGGFCAAVAIIGIRMHVSDTWTAENVSGIVAEYLRMQNGLMNLPVNAARAGLSRRLQPSSQRIILTNFSSIQAVVNQF